MPLYCALIYDCLRNQHILYPVRLLSLYATLTIIPGFQTMNIYITGYGEFFILAMVRVVLAVFLKNVQQRRTQKRFLVPNSTGTHCHAYQKFTGSHERLQAPYIDSWHAAVNIRGPPLYICKSHWTRGDIFIEPQLGKQISFRGSTCEVVRTNSTHKFTTINQLEDGLSTLVISTHNLDMCDPRAGNSVSAYFRPTWLRVPAPKRCDQPHSDCQHRKPKVCGIEMTTTTSACTLDQVGGVLCSTACIL